MTMEQTYKELKEIQKLLWLDDDRMDQDVLFEVQTKMANTLRRVAKKANKTKDLVDTFPYLYDIKTK